MTMTRRHYERAEEYAADAVAYAADTAVEGGLSRTYKKE